MRPEADLLLCCARLRTGLESNAQIDALLAQHLDWLWLVQTAGTHGLLPLLYASVNARSSAKLGRAALDRRREEFFRTAQRNLAMLQELLAIAELFAANRIPTLPYKGPVLAAAEYGNLALRPFCDLDILVPKRHVHRAKDLLVARGYVPEHRLTPRHEATWMHARNDVQLHRPDRDIVVELHWEVVRRRLCVPFDTDQLWARTLTVSIGGRNVQTLAPEDLLLVLVVHGAKHGWTRLIWICDIAAIVANHADLDWVAVADQARRLGIERMLRVGLLLGRDLVGCELPEHMRRLPEDRAATRLAHDVRARLFTERDARHSAVTRTLFHLKIRERVRDKIKFAAYTAIVPSAADRLLVGFPQYLAMLYYVLRPFRLARKYCRGPIASSAVPR